ncbi:hypothetical protein [Roseospira goensis]|uniref:Uncharacterized protein n=1 Tax=Roseospira goensis TaxID=391922 RepID=A0A7W6WJ65_9PROT|nr:hypothetical protein [Roseospira goensis]MBB4284384.1 hypothetical protein [Roseospira goensis]
MSEAAAIVFIEVFMWAGGAFFLLWLDRRNLNKAKAETARRKALEAQARAAPSPALVPTGATAAGSEGEAAVRPTAPATPGR